MRAAAIAIACLLVALFGAPAAAAENLLAPQGTRWVVVASRPDADAAIGIARGYRWAFDAIRVVESANGWKAVVGGPIPARDPARAKAQLLELGLPDDVFLADGARFVRTLWTGAADPGELHELDDRPVAFELDGLAVEMAWENPADDFPVARVVGREGGRVAFDLRLEGFVRSVPLRARLLPLDRAAPQERQIVITGFTGGAHCCVETTILARRGPGAWLTIEGPMLDGASGYAFEDLDGDGVYEMISADQSFLYAYAPYAGSFAPLVVQRLAGKRILEVRDEPGARAFFRQDLARLEHEAERNPELWSENGFLAAWVAGKARLGEADEAFARTAASFDKRGDWPLTVCEVPRDAIGDCPAGRERDATFPEALEAHLRERGYLGG